MKNVQRKTEKVCLKQSGLLIWRKGTVLRNKDSVAVNLFGKSKVGNHKPQRLIAELGRNFKFCADPDVMTAFTQNMPQIVDALVLEFFEFVCIS